MLNGGVGTTPLQLAALIGADPASSGSPAFASWSDLWQTVAPQFQAQRRLLILDTDRSLLENVRNGVLAPGSLALGEVLFLLYDELREPRAHLAILEAIGNGHHTFKAIKDATLLGDMHLPAYLSTLQEMRYVERRLPVTIPLAKQRISRQGRYHLSDPFMRFYFRFVHPHRDVVSYAPERILPALQSGLRTFVEQTSGLTS